jgi:hypothetical protein
MKYMLFKWLYKEEMVCKNITFIMYAQEQVKQILKKAHQGKTPAGLTSEKYFIAFKQLAHEREQFTTPPPTRMLLFRGFCLFPPFFKKNNYLFKSK